jgi:DNA-binding PadR family transcriptional regulator
MSRQLLLLGLLRQQEMHGYQLNEFINRDLASCTDLKKSTAYFVLNKMAEDGWINQEQAQAGNRPPRRVYSLSPQGEAVFQRLLRENLADFEASVFPGDAGLAFLDAIPAEEALDLLEKRRRSLAAAFEAARAAPAHQGSFRLVIEHRIRHLQAELAWLDEVIAGLRTHTAEGEES